MTCAYSCAECCQRAHTRGNDGNLKHGYETGLHERPSRAAKWRLATASPRQFVGCGGDPAVTTAPATCARVPAHRIPFAPLIKGLALCLHLVVLLLDVAITVMTPWHQHKQQSKSAAIRAKSTKPKHVGKVQKGMLSPCTCVVRCALAVTARAVSG